MILSEARPIRKKAVALNQSETFNGRRKQTTPHFSLFPEVELT